jgi:hypothetical protein
LILKARAAEIDEVKDKAGGLLSSFGDLIKKASNIQKQGELFIQQGVVSNVAGGAYHWGIYIKNMYVNQKSWVEKIKNAYEHDEQLDQDKMDNRYYRYSERNRNNAKRVEEWINNARIWLVNAGSVQLAAYSARLEAARATKAGTKTKEDDEYEDEYSEYKNKTLVKQVNDLLRDWRDLDRLMKETDMLWYKFLDALKACRMA